MIDVQLEGEPGAADGGEVDAEAVDVLVGRQGKSERQPAGDKPPDAGVLRQRKRGGGHRAESRVDPASCRPRSGA